MKTVFLTLILFFNFTNLVAFDPNIPHACDPNPADTESSLNEKMCGCAEKYLSEISSENNKKGNDFDLEMRQIKSLIAKRKIIEDSKNLVDSYLNGFNKIFDPIKNKNNVKKQLENYNNTLNQAMMLNAMKEGLLKDKKILERKDFDLVDYCRNKYSDMPISESMGFICTQQISIAKDQVFNTTDFSKAFNSLVEIYKVATVEDSSKFDEKLNSILSLIPKAASPSVVIELAKNYTPTIVSTLADSKLSNCLQQNAKNISKECEVTFKTLEKDKNDKLVSELTVLPSVFQDSAKAAEKYESSKEKLLIDASNKLNNAFGKNIYDAYNLIKNPPTQDAIVEGFKQAASEIDKTTTKAQELDKLLKQYPELQGKSTISEDIVNYSAKCGSKASIDDLKGNPIKMDEKIAECSQLLVNLKDKFKDTDTSDIENKITALTDTMKHKMNNDVNRNSHLIQNYVANKWFRQCSNKGAKKAVPEIVQGCPNDPSSPITRMKIGDSIFPIIGKINSSYIKSQPFAGAELKEYRDACRKTDQTGIYAVICQSLDSDYDNSKNIKTTEEWSQAREKSYVVYDDNSPGGFRLEPKKTTRSIIGSAILTGVVKEAPFFINNYVARQNISFMEQQAMYQKQWMWDSSQAQNYWLNNIFSNSLSNSTTSSSIFTMPTTLTGSTYSYNFGSN